MSWLSVLKEWIEFIWPFTKVGVWEGGLRFTYVPTFFLPWWKKPFYKKFPARVIQTPLESGMHRRIPWIEDVFTESMVDDTFDIKVQSVTTKDRKKITYRVSVVYEIFNVGNAHTKVHDYENSMHSLTMIYMARRLRRSTLDELLDQQDEIEQELRADLHEKSKKWGTRIKDIGLTTLVETRQFNHFQTQL